ncbi:DUF2924 family protein [Azospirillaceae bacterium]
MTLPLLKQIADLQGKSQDDLKSLWQEYFGTEPPAYRRGFLVRGLAQRIQELTYGGLPATHQARLDTLIEDKPSKAKAPVNGAALLSGTRLVRDWQGVAHHVTVLSDGFEYQGRRFKSLSAIANLITGTRWNGWAFFGAANPNKREKRQ